MIYIPIAFTGRYCLPPDKKRSGKYQSAKLILQMVFEKEDIEEELIEKLYNHISKEDK